MARLGLLVALLVVVTAPSPAGAVPVAKPVWAADGRVNTVALVGETAYVGGLFTAVGEPAFGLAAVDADTAALDRDWPVSLDWAGATTADGAGGFYVAGSFAVAGVRRESIFHVRADRTIDPAFLPTVQDPAQAGPDYSVADLLLDGDRLYAAGTFSGVNGTPHPYLVALDTATGAPLPWNPAPSAPVYSIARAGSVIYAGGEFTSVNVGQPSVPRNHLAAFDVVTGAATSFNPNVDAAVVAVVATGTTVYAGGNFATVNAGAPTQAARSRAAAFDTAGAVTAWNPAPNQQVMALARSGTTVYLGGFFTTVNGGVSRPGLAAVDQTTGAATAFDAAIGHADGPIVDGIEVGAGRLVLTGRFTSASGAARNGVAAVDPGTGAVSAWNPVPGHQPAHAVAVGSHVVLTGSFRTVNGALRDNLAAIDLRTGRATEWNPRADGEVTALAAGAAVIYTAGDFGTVNGSVSHPYAAAFDAGSGAVTGWNPRPDPYTVPFTARALRVSGSTVFLGGPFQTVNNGAADRPHVAGLDATTGAATAFRVTPSSGISDPEDGLVTALAGAGSRVYLGGLFVAFNGVAGRRWVAAVDEVPGAAGTLAPFSAAAATAALSNRVDSLLLSGSTLYVGRRGVVAGHAPLAAYDVQANTQTAFLPALDARVRTLALVGDTLYAGGAFASPRDRLAAFSATTGALSPFDAHLADDGNLAVDDDVRGLAGSVEAGLIAVGAFRWGDDGLRPMSGLAAFALEPQAPAGVTATAGDAQATVQFSAPADGGSAITAYTVAATPGGRTASGPASPITVDGLDNGTAYTFTVTAANLAGNGPASAPSSAVTPAAPPAPEPTAGPAVSPTPSAGPAPVATATPSPGPGAGPGPGATPVPLKAAEAFRLPSARRCVARRTLRIALARPPGTRLTSVVFRIGARTLKTVRGAALTRPVTLRRLPRGRFTLRVSATTADGRTTSQSRRYRSC